MFRHSSATILTTFLLLKVVDSFSTPARFPSFIRSYVSANGHGVVPSNRGTGRSFGNSPVENSQPHASYTSNYITSIEDQSTIPYGLFVASTDHNYAIVSPNLTQQNWLSLSVNGEQVDIIRKEDNSTRSIAMTSMSLIERDFIAEIRSNFTQNLAGLKFAHYTSGSSLIIGNLVPQKNRGYQPIPSGQYQTVSNGRRNFKSWPLPATANAHNLFNKHTVNHKQPVAARSTGGGGVRSANLQTNELSTGQCQQSFGQSTIETNYYNLQITPLNKTLAGDVYFFDFYCNILDVYSSTVSVRRNLANSLLYRNSQFFTYSGLNLPLSVNRLFHLNDWLVFVYNDGTISIEQIWMLESDELDSIVKIRSQLRNIENWQQKAAQLMTSENDNDNQNSSLSKFS